MSYISQFFRTLFFIGLMASPLHAAMRQGIDDADTQRLIAFMQATPAQKRTFMEDPREGVLEKHPRLKRRLNHVDFTGTNEDIKRKNYEAFIGLCRADWNDPLADLSTRVHAGLGMARLFARKGIYSATPSQPLLAPTIENFREEVLVMLRDIQGFANIRPSHHYYALLWESIIEADGYLKGVGGAAHLQDLDHAWTLLGEAEALKEQHNLSKNVYLWKSSLLAVFDLRPLAVPPGQDGETYHKQQAEDLYDLYKNRVPRPAPAPLLLAGHVAPGGNFMGTTHRVEYQTDRGRRGDVDETEARLEAALAAWQVPGVMPGGFAPGGGFPPAPGGGFPPAPGGGLGGDGFGGGAGHHHGQDDDSDDDSHGPNAGGGGSAALQMMDEHASKITDAPDGRDSSTTEDPPVENPFLFQSMEYDGEGVPMQALVSPVISVTEGDGAHDEEGMSPPAPMIEPEDTPSEEEQTGPKKRSAIEYEDDDEVLHRGARKNRRIVSDDEESEERIVSDDEESEEEEAATVSVPRRQKFRSQQDRQESKQRSKMREARNAEIVRLHHAGKDEKAIAAQLQPLYPEANSRYVQKILRDKGLLSKTGLVQARDAEIVRLRNASLSYTEIEQALKDSYPAINKSIIVKVIAKAGLSQKMATPRLSPEEYAAKKSQAIEIYQRAQAMGKKSFHKEISAKTSLSERQVQRIIMDFRKEQDLVASAAARARTEEDKQEKRAPILALYRQQQAEGKVDIPAIAAQTQQSPGYISRVINEAVKGGEILITLRRLTPAQEELLVTFIKSKPTLTPHEIAEHFNHQHFEGSSVVKEWRVKDIRRDINAGRQ